MATLYQQLAASIQDFTRIVDEAERWTEGKDDETFALPDGRVVNSFAKSIKALNDAAAAIENLPMDLASTDAGKGASLVALESGLNLQQYLPALTVLGSAVEQFLLNPPSSGYYGDGVANATAPIQSAIDAAGAAGGGDIYIPRGDYPVTLTVSGSNVRIICEQGTTLRAVPGATSKAVVDIVSGADHIEITGPTVTGQTLAQEGGASSGNGTRNCEALYGIRVAGTNVTLRDFETKAARQDGVYVTHEAGTTPTNLKIANFYLGDTSRNPISFIAGRHITMRNGTVYQKGDYFGATDVDNGYVLFDIEPNAATQIVQTLRIEDVDFINANPKSGTQHLIFLETNDGNNDYDIDMLRCRFIKQGSVAAPSIRCIPSSAVARGIRIRGLESDGYVFAYENGDPLTSVQDSVVEDVVIASSILFYGTKPGSGTHLARITSTAGAVDGPSISGAQTRRDVQGLADVVGASARQRINSSYRLESQVINVASTAVFTDVVEVGLRGTFKITIAGADASAGRYGLFAAEAWISVSTDSYASSPPVVQVDGPAGASAAVQWKDATPYGSAGAANKTLQLKPQSAASNLYVVTVEVFSSYEDSLADVTFLV